jgi:hypothetical protein
MLRLILNKLRSHLPTAAVYHAVLALMIILEGLTFISLVWYFFLRGALPLPPVGWAVAGGVYTLLAAAFILMNLSGGMLCFKVQGFLYLSVALFFFLKGLMFIYAREFNPWGFYLLWIALFAVTLRESMREMGPESGDNG